MKYLLVALFVAVLLMPFAAADYALLSASLMKYEPVPAEPGKYITVYIKLENDGDKAAKDVVMELMPHYPFSIDGSDQVSKNLGTLGSQREYVFDFKLRVAADAVTGDNELRMRFTSDNGIWQENVFTITLQSGDATLGVVGAALQPAIIAPGEKGMLTIRVKNMADDVLKDITIALDLFSSTTATATSVSVLDPPFAPIGLTNEQKIFQLASGNTEEFAFPLQAYTSASPGLYKIPINITYYDNVGTKYTLQQLIGVVVGSEPELSVVVDSTTLRSVPMMGDITLKVINKGLSDVKFLDMRLGESAAYEIMSASNEVYLGNLDSDDYDTATYKLKLLTAQDLLSLPVSIAYRDANNNPYVLNTTVVAKLYANGDDTKAPVGLIVFIVIVLGVIGFFIYRKFRKPRKK
ncbi:MAG: COG1361 S-layer family protein [archaeon]